MCLWFFELQCFSQKIKNKKLAQTNTHADSIFCVVQIMGIDTSQIAPTEPGVCASEDNPIIIRFVLSWTFKWSPMFHFGDPTNSLNPVSGYCSLVKKSWLVG